ncbi:hypothetical protein [Nocardioides sp. Leaf374]|uniref:hypothetical protein n=1 Tax=Nocardioides sp. Leaf374 TaxID=2876560 RepID=UPI001E609758|nr:hypothetical protein [Nocardioides sp. Leaf374]
MTWIEAPKSSDPVELAHYIEAEMLVSGEEYLSLAEVRDGWTSGQAPSEEELDFAFAEIDRRARHMGTHYPFFTVDNGVGFDKSGSSDLYSFLTLLSLRETPLRLAKDYPRSDPLFDAVVREAVRAALGPRAQALVFGWPPRGGRPSEFPKAVEWLAKRLGVGLRSHEAYSESLDGGVDIIGWAPFPDGQIAFPIVLAQNTIQRAFVKKPRDVVPEDWREWIRVKSDPLVGFAVPFFMRPKDPWWERAGTNVTYLWDRGRLVHELRLIDPTSWPEWPDIRAFVEEEVAGLHGSVAAAKPVDALPRSRKDRVIPPPIAATGC